LVQKYYGITELALLTTLLDFPTTPWLLSYGKDSNHGVVYISRKKPILPIGLL